jgi:hypothetical protein
MYPLLEDSNVARPIMDTTAMNANIKDLKPCPLYYLGTTNSGEEDLSVFVLFG